MGLEHTDKPITKGPRYTLVGGTPWTIPNIGGMIDAMAAGYRKYINRETGEQGQAAIREFRKAADAVVAHLPALYEFLYSHLPIPAPPINRTLREAIEASCAPAAFHFRWLSFYQLCQHWSARENLDTIEKRVQKIELIYEMHNLAKDMVELSYLVPTAPEPIKGLPS